MTVATSHGRMPSAQRKAGLRMIELDLVLNYFPVLSGVAVAAGQVEFAMRTLRGSKRPR